jgi:Zn-dependent protease/predicted transcriptional regulator
MHWSWKIGRFAGIDVFMHATFLLLLGWVALSAWLQDHTVAAMAHALIFIIALFVCVVLHEYGHALVARRYGIPTRDITLLPIGGVSRLERMPDEPREELRVAVAGALVNIAIAAVLYVVLLLTGSTVPLTQVDITTGPFIPSLILVNILLAVFNLIPAFPMDGGRVLRAALATRMNYVRATNLAASFGQAFALLFGFVGLFYNPFLIFIALFVWIGAAQEASMTSVRSSLSGIPVAHAMIQRFQTLAPEDRLSKAVELVLSGSQQDFPVAQDGQPVGVLTRDDLMVALERRGSDTLVSDVMRRQFDVLDSHDMLQTASDKLQQCDCHTMLVVHSGQLVGMVTMDNIGEYLMVRAAMGQPRHQGGPGGAQQAA